MKSTLFLSFVVVSSAGFGQVAGGMDHINPVGLDLVSTLANGRIQVFTDTPEQSRMVVDDFFADKNLLTEATLGFEINGNQPIEHPDGWRISVWASLADAANSGNDFSANAVQTLYVPFESGTWTQTPLFGTGTTFQAAAITFHDLNMDIGNGVRYIGIAPVQASTSRLNWFILDHKNPLLLGNNTPNDSFGINPSGALGLGTTYSIGTNASYSVNLVPEPVSVVAMAMGLSALCLRLRRQKAA